MALVECGVVLLGIFGIVFVYVFLYFYYAKPTYCNSKNQINNQTVLITGGSTGIGNATALELAKRGGRIYIASRNRTKGEEAVKDIIAKSGNRSIYFLTVDLSDLGSIRKFVSTFTSQEDKLHLLINNAAIAYSKEQRTIYGYHDPVFATNYLGHFLLTYLLIDLLKRSKPSKIINVSSVSHTFVQSPLNVTACDAKHSKTLYPYLKGYDESKLANILHAKELTRKFAGNGVTANAVHPGMVVTDLWYDMNQIVPEPLCWLLRAVFKPLFMEPHVAAQTVIYLAVSDEVEGISGKYFRQCRIDSESAYARSSDTSLALWTASKLITGCTENGRVILPPNVYYTDEELERDREESNMLYYQELKPTLVPNLIDIDRL